MAKKKLLAGKKINNRHSTVNALAEQVILLLKPCDAIKKIVLGPISSVKSGPRRLTVRNDQHQVKIQCRSGSSVQILWVIGADKEKVEDLLKPISSKL